MATLYKKAKPIKLKPIKKDGCHGLVKILNRPEKR